LQAYEITFKTPLGMSSYRVINSELCHAFVEIKHWAWQTINMFNYDLTKTDVEKRLQLSEPQ